MSFLLLPIELFLEISRDLHPTDLNALLRTNRALSNLIRPILTDRVCQRLFRLWAKRALYSAAERKDEPMMRRLVEKGVLDLVWRKEVLLCDVVVETKSESAIRTLLDFGVDPEARDLKHHTPLSLAVRDGLVGIVKVLLARADVNVNTQCSRGQTPLHIAAGNGNRELVQLLLADPNISVNTLGGQRYTALHMAAKAGSVACVEMLLGDRRVNVKPLGYSLWTPLHLAANQGHEAVVRILLKDGRFDVNAQDDHGSTPLYEAARVGSDDTVSLLMAHRGVDINRARTNGWTPLHIAVQRWHAPVVKLLLDDERLKPNCQGRQGGTPVYIAATSSSLIMMETLLSHPGVDINATSLKFNAPGSHIRRESTVIRMSQSHPNFEPLPPYKYLRTPLVEALSTGYSPMVELLMQDSRLDLFSATPPPPLLHIAASHGLHHAVKMLLENGRLDVNAQDRYGMTPLHYGVLSDSFEVMQILLSDPRISANLLAFGSWTPLHLAAAYKGFFQTSNQLFQDRRFDINAQDINGDTPIHVAAKSQRERIMVILLRDDADLEIRNKQGLLAKDLAVEASCSSCAIMAIDSHYQNQIERRKRDAGESSM